MELPKRKKMRLDGYDYSQNGAYFITICTHNRKILFGVVGEDSISSRMIDTVFHRIIKQYPHITCPQYVVMPNHFHAIVIVERADMESAPTTISEFIQSFKRYSTLEYIKMVKQDLLPCFEKHIWQRSFYDRVIRSEQEYQNVWQYINENPLKWEEDCYYIP
ncbi:MAG: transposase [Oscillospiraceae bacterium]|nr:transposase [Oscillospiraceae bacterium]MDD4414778.1 transposase [Oscillospiraceae bacterium]